MSKTSRPMNKHDKMKQQIEEDNDAFIGSEMKLQQVDIFVSEIRQQMMQDQDQDLDQLHDVVGNLKAIGNAMDTAVKEQEG